MEAYQVDIEVDVSNGLPSIEMVGLLHSEVKESRERVRAAIKNADIHIPPARITVNLAPANVHKRGTLYDFPIAIGMLSAMGHVSEELLVGACFLGELSLDGTINAVDGVLPIVAHLKHKGVKKYFVPYGNASEASGIKEVDIIPVHTLKEFIDYAKGKSELSKFSVHPVSILQNKHNDLDFCHVQGQKIVKRAVEIAVSGKHNILMMGPPGSGKSMISKRISSILPTLSEKDALEVSKIYSIAGMLKDKSFITQPPFRMPHHTITPQALAGGGRYPKPGEVTLAHNGVLFLDEFAEFKSNTLDILRQPLEDQKITISRMGAHYEFPADFILVAAMNPCKCGYYPDRTRCNCTEYDVSQYTGKISGPLLDRIDIAVNTPEVKLKELNRAKDEESSSVIQQRVIYVRNIQKERYRQYGIQCNGQLTIPLIKKFCKLEQEECQYMNRLFEQLRLSARGYYKVLRLSRTIADMEGEERIKSKHISEAIMYRTFS